MGTPAIEDPWYLLATLAGTESLNHAENQCLWNGYQRVLLGDQFPPDDPDMAKLPTLSEADLTRIRAIEHLPTTLGPNIAIDFDGVEFPAVNFDKFYFGVYVSWDNATFRGAAWFDDTVFVGRAWFGDSTFHQEAHFHDVAGTRKAVPLSFKRASFTRHPPDFYGRTMHGDTDWTAAR